MTYQSELWADDTEFVDSTMMQYPFINDPTNTLTMDQVLAIEANMTQFLGQVSMERLNYFPFGCIKYKIKRTTIAIWPKDNYTQAIIDNL